MVACHNLINGVRTPRTHQAMTETTTNALDQLTEALIANPEDLKEIQKYLDTLVQGVEDFIEEN